MSEAYLVVNWLHVLVMGYWIGSDLVVNQLTHFTARSSWLEGGARGRLWDFLLHVDQHPRNALILSMPLGLTLAAWLGLSPIRGPWLALAWLLSGLWFWHMWRVHLRGATPAGQRLRAWDWRIRYLVIAASLAAGAASLATGYPFAANWLALKVLLFAGVVACGLGIRYYIREYLKVWPEVLAGRSTPAIEAMLRGSMVRGTWVLALLHAQLWAIGLLGVLKPF